MNVHVAVIGYHSEPIETGIVRYGNVSKLFLLHSPNGKRAFEIEAREFAQSLITKGWCDVELREINAFDEYNVIDCIIGIFNEDSEQKYYVNITGGTKLTAAAAAVAAFIIGAESYYVLDTREIKSGDDPIKQLDLPRINPLRPIKGVQLDILKFLVNTGGTCNTPEICDGLDTTGKALHHHINKLELFRLITRKESNNDGRVKILSITNAGRVVVRYSIF